MPQVWELRAGRAVQARLREPCALAALRAQRKANAAVRLAYPVWVEHGLLFPYSVGTVQDSRNLRKALRPRAASVGFPGSFHALALVASVAVSSVPLTVVSKVLGRQRASATTDLYSHLLESDAGSVAVAVTVAVRNARKASS